MSDIIKHKPIEGILNRELSIALAEPIIGKYSPYLKELINYATNVLTRCEQSTKRNKGANLSPICLYYQAIQFTDGIEVLVSQSCFAATKPLLRSLMEVTFSMEYMIENNYELLSKAWLAQSYLKRIASLESLDSSTPKGKAFQKGLRNDKFIDPDNINITDRKNIKLEIDDINRVLSKSKFNSIVSAFKGKDKIKNWYQLNDGPRNFEILAKELRRQSEYETLYRRFSDTVHAINTREIVEEINGIKVFVPIRRMLELDDNIFILAGAFLNNCTLALGSKFRPEENIRNQIKEIVLRHRPEDFQSGTQGS